MGFVLVFVCTAQLGYVEQGIDYIIQLRFLDRRPGNLGPQFIVIRSPRTSAKIDARIARYIQLQHHLQHA